MVSSFSDPSFEIRPAASAHRVSGSGTKLQLRAQPETDWWRVPPTSAAPEIDSRTGAFFATPVDAQKDFAAGVWIRGAWDGQFDQGCLMLLAGSSDDVQGDWIKAGVEVEDGHEFIGAVVTSPFSDWAIAPAAHSTSTSGDSPYAVYIKMVREGPLVTLSQYLSPTGASPSPPAASHLTKFREIRGFNLDAQGRSKASVGDKWRVGVMVCGPKNKEGTVAQFEYFSVDCL